jgi:hydroxyacylglutathione hydrolase
MLISWVHSAVPYDSNMFLIEDRRNVLIDSGTGLDSDSTIRTLKKVLDGHGLDTLILTHCHMDHIGGSHRIAEEFGCKVCAGATDAIHIRNADSKFILNESFGIDILPSDVADLHEGEILETGSCRLHIIATPGHTAGGICIYDEISQSLFSGDTVFADGYGRTDLPSGSSSDMLESLMKLSNIEIKTLYPGHGAGASNGNTAVRCSLQMMSGFQ